MFYINLKKSLGFSTSIIALSTLLGLGSLTSVAALAMDDGGAAKPNKVYQATFKPETGAAPDDYVTFLYEEGSSQITWQGQVTLLNGCQGLKSHTLNDIYYFMPPKSTDPIFSFNLEVTSSGQICTQVVKTQEFSGVKEPIYLNKDQTENFKTLFAINWIRPETRPQTQWWERVDFTKLRWRERNIDSLNWGIYKYSIQGRVLEEGESEENCISVRYGLIGRWCKTVQADPRNGKMGLKSLIITSASQLRRQLGPVNTLDKLHFVSDALRGNGWDRGETIFRGRNLIRIQGECTQAIRYYELRNTSSGYQLDYLKEDIDTSVPAICE
jgi:hypothetical protein